MDKTTRSRRDFAALEARRLAAARLFSQGRSQAEVARQLGVSRVSALRWFRAWQPQGRRGLRAAGRAGRKPRMDTSARKRLEAALLKGPTSWGFPTHLWTLERVAHVIWNVCGVRYHPGHVWRVLRSLGWSRQRPSRLAKERDERAIRRWVRREWPRIKKKHDA